jgi:hypothetical protein
MQQQKIILVHSGYANKAHDLSFCLQLEMENNLVQDMGKLRDTVQ